MNIFDLLLKQGFVSSQQGVVVKGAAISQKESFTQILGKILQLPKNRQESIKALHEKSPVLRNIFILSNQKFPTTQNNLSSPNKIQLYNVLKKYNEIVSNQQYDNEKFLQSFEKEQKPRIVQRDEKRAFIREDSVAQKITPHTDANLLNNKDLQQDALKRLQQSNKDKFYETGHETVVVKDKKQFESTFTNHASPTIEVKSYKKHIIKREAALSNSYSEPAAKQTKKQTSAKNQEKSKKDLPLQNIENLQNSFPGNIIQEQQKPVKAKVVAEQKKSKSQTVSKVFAKQKTIQSSATNWKRETSANDEMQLNEIKNIQKSAGNIQSSIKTNNLHALQLSQSQSMFMDNKRNFRKDKDQLHNISQRNENILEASYDLPSMKTAIKRDFDKKISLMSSSKIKINKLHTIHKEKIANRIKESTIQLQTSTDIDRDLAEVILHLKHNNHDGTQQTINRDLPNHSEKRGVEQAMLQQNSSGSYDSQSHDMFHDDNGHLAQEFMQTEGEHEFFEQSLQQRAVRIKIENTYINISMAQNCLNLHFVSQSPLQLQPDLQEYVESVMKDSGYEKYRVRIKDREKQTEFFSEDSSEQTKSANGSVNVKV
ncbi:hypothetical protein NitYY0826_C0721 [Nitratiruptor sp. YY08-26]|uniref:hypothetical protein n=1 Tax=unclassified Nitratiruptor TaxID=2624044 RepID=UPI0019169D70|nr:MULTISPECIES: hypothetical protein [unclassified Nitratiruptor]BCD61858.1 hypothetical protein NitYY0813_C0719 [Nitratiruptor sp. YY08-13]BCD65793.1 hypothetical protein NitYY0826_C0721 [Nitratiruptor sp. YY08-26]